MKVLFVYPNLMRQENISLGIASLSAYLKQHGHATALVDFTWGGTVGSTIAAVRKTRPQLVAFSVRTGEFRFALRVARAVKLKFGPDIKVVFGGVHPTVLPHEVMKWDCIDFVCVGEGELSLLDLCNRIDAGEDCTEIRGLWTRHEGQVIRNPLNPLIPDLDQLPFPDRELFDIRRYIASRDGGIDVMSSRGCPFNCRYCINGTLHILYKGMGAIIRKRSVRKTLDDIDRLMRLYEVTGLFFQDDFFGTPLSWVKEFSICSQELLQGSFREAF